MKQIKSLITGLTLLALSSPVAVFASRPLPDPPPAPGLRTIDQLYWIFADLAVWVSRFFWAVAAAGIIFAAFLFLTSRGDPAALKKAKEALLWAVVAILVALFAPVAHTLITNIFIPR